VDAGDLAHPLADIGKIAAMCAIRSAKGFGMKCVHASIRIMGGGPPTWVAGAASGKSGRRGVRAN